MVRIVSCSFCMLLCHIYSHEIKNKFQMRFILSGGTIMTIIENIKGIMVGNREFGNFAIYIYRSYEKVKANMT